MEHFVARQPIFDRNLKVFAYELLFRSGLDNYFGQVDGDQATSRVIADSFLLFGIGEMTGGAKAFINFTRNLLVRDFALALPRDHAVIEILENVEPEDDVLASCRKLKENGFLLALDDFVFHDRFLPFVELADIIKVDFIESGEDERRRLAEVFTPKGIRMLAEKVETREDVDQAREMGYSYFQGYFFSKPVIVSRKDVPAFKVHYMRILKEINAPEVDFGDLARTIEADVSITYKLLKYVNSAAFGLRSNVSSILQALTLLGEIEVRRWASLLTLTEMASDKPAELVVSSLTRAKFCELLSSPIGLGDRQSDLFMMGLFSLIDAVVGRPLEEILDEVPVADEVREALLGGAGRLRLTLDLFLNLDQADWPAASATMKQLKVEEVVVAQAYVTATQWPHQVFFG